VGWKAGCGARGGPGQGPRDLAYAVPVTVIATVWLALFGLILGSFLALAADRLPRGESLVRPRSHCRACGRVLNALDLAPVAGYLLRRGRCATCGARIGWFHPVLEVVCGICMLLPVLLLGPWPGGLLGLVAVGVVGGSAARLTASGRAARLSNRIRKSNSRR
jgi:prepilin signal peptidase PulO-like enzyme (type II secretory pathway)